jgi:hypothetical protein
MKRFFPLFLFFFLGASSEDVSIALQCPPEIWMHIVGKIGRFLKEEHLIQVDYETNPYSQEEKIWATTIHALFCVSRYFSEIALSYTRSVQTQLTQYFVEGNFFEKKVVPYRPLILMLRIWEKLEQEGAIAYELKTRLKELYQLRTMSDFIAVCRSEGRRIPDDVLKKVEVCYQNKPYFFSTEKYCLNYILPRKISFLDQWGQGIWQFLFFSSSIPKMNLVKTEQENSRNGTLKKLFLHYGSGSQLLSEFPALQVLYLVKSKLPGTFVVKNYFANLHTLEVVNASNIKDITIDLRESKVQDIIVKNTKGTIFLPVMVRFMLLFNNSFLDKYIKPIFAPNTRIDYCILNGSDAYFSDCTNQESYKTVSIGTIEMTIRSNKKSHDIKKELEKAKIIEQYQLKILPRSP